MVVSIKWINAVLLSLCLYSTGQRSVYLYDDHLPDLYFCQKVSKPCIRRIVVVRKRKWCIYRGRVKERIFPQRRKMCCTGFTGPECDIREMCGKQQKSVDFYLQSHPRELSNGIQKNHETNCGCNDSRKGDLGASGKQGLKGVKGDPGTTGKQGPRGDTGPKGDKGSRGYKGSSGVRGPAGVKGSRGVPGFPGTPGTPIWQNICPCHDLRTRIEVLERQIEELMTNSPRAGDLKRLLKTTKSSDSAIAEKSSLTTMVAQRDTTDSLASVTPAVHTSTSHAFTNDMGLSSGDIELDADDSQNTQASTYVTQSTTQSSDFLFASVTTSPPVTTPPPCTPDSNDVSFCNSKTLCQMPKPRLQRPPPLPPSNVTVYKNIMHHIHGLLFLPDKCDCAKYALAFYNSPT